MAQYVDIELLDNISNFVSFLLQFEYEFDRNGRFLVNFFENVRFAGVEWFRNFSAMLEQNLTEEQRAELSALEKHLETYKLNPADTNEHIEMLQISRSYIQPFLQGVEELAGGTF